MTDIVERAENLLAATIRADHESEEARGLIKELSDAVAIADAYGRLVTTPSAARALPQLRRALRDGYQQEDQS